jgi:hypothetical protein
MENKVSLLVAIGIVFIVILGMMVIRQAVIMRSKPSSNLTTTVPSAIAPPTVQPRAEMWIDPPEMQIAQGGTITVRVMIDAHNTIINGTDAIVNYDQDYLEVVSIDKPNEPNNEFSLFSRQSDGQLQITRTKQSVSDVPTAQLTIAEVTFRTVKTGTTAVRFDYQKGATNKSTIIEQRSNKNILDKVTGVKIEIGNL